MSAQSPRILVIDDEPQIHRFLRPALEANGFEMLSAMTGSEGLAALTHRPPDAVVLDLGLPDQDGQDVLIAARRIYEGPILILSAREKEAEKIRALDNNADDYVEKPFGVGEFMARLRAALRGRVIRAGVAPVVRSHDVEVDLVQRMVTRAGEPVRLSPREYDLRVGRGPGRRGAISARLRGPPSPEAGGRPGGPEDYRDRAGGGVSLLAGRVSEGLGAITAVA
jgi:two-component system KDP operon response regulator KdpE